MCCCGRHGWWRGSVLNNNDLAESAVTVDLLDLAVANGVLMSALAFPGRHGWSGHCAWTRVCGIQLVVVLIMVAKDLGGGQVVVNRLHCLCESERRGGKRSRGKLGQVFGRGQLNGGHHCKPLPNCLLFFFVYFLPLLLSLSSSSSSPPRQSVWYTIYTWYIPPSPVFLAVFPARASITVTLEISDHRVTTASCGHHSHCDSP